MPGTRRVVITGIGMVSPVGCELDAFWRAILDGPSAIARITRFDASPYACRIAGEVRDSTYEELIEPRKIRTTPHVTRLALAATELARRHARLVANDPDLFGVIIGTALGGWRDAEQQHAILLARGVRRINPFIASATPNHAIGTELATALGARGAQATFSSGCPSSLQAISHAAALIAHGELEVCLAGGAESPLSATVFASMARTLELSTRNDEPERASRPFDEAHDGLVLSEGSCMLVLEEAEHAVRRGVMPYAEILGGITSCDAKGLYGFDASGAAGAGAIHRLLQRSAVPATGIDYVCAHANSSAAFDRKETLVIKRAFGECAARLPVSSIKGAIGHPFGASGAFQVAATALAIRHGLVPPSLNLDVPDPQCDLDYVPGRARPVRVRTALVTSYGYGGVNAYLLVSEPR